MKLDVNIPLLLLVLAAAGAGLHCARTPSGPPFSGVALVANHVACTEAVVQLSLIGIGPNPVIALRRDDRTIFQGRLGVTDTLFLLDSLQPSQSYELTAAVLEGGTTRFSSPPLALRTLDSTSHAFTWTVTRLNLTSADANDVCIVNDTLAYAVGEFHLPGTDTLYNVIRWNGTTWSPMKVEVVFNGYTIVPPLYGCVAFSPSDIWLVGTDAIHGDGQRWEDIDVRPILNNDYLGFRCGWGTSSHDLYLAGASGGLVHYDGRSWREIPTGTTKELFHIAGIASAGDGLGQTVYCLTGNFFEPGVGAGILQYDRGGTPRWLPWDPQSFVCGVWTPDGMALYVGGWQLAQLLAGEWRTLFRPPATIAKIRGNSAADIMAVGDYGLLYHFNGVTWSRTSIGGDDILSSVDTRPNMVVAVGFSENGFVGVIGRR